MTHTEDDSLSTRIIRFFGWAPALHTFEYYKRFYQEQGIIYYMRRCECGLEQVKSAGPAGDNKWKDVDHDWKEWEKERFDKSIEMTQEEIDATLYK